MCLVSGAPDCPHCPGCALFPAFPGTVSGPAAALAPEPGIFLIGYRNHLNCFCRGPWPGLTQAGHENPVLDFSLLPCGYLLRCALETVDFYSIGSSLIL